MPPPLNITLCRSMCVRPDFIVTTSGQNQFKLQGQGLDAVEGRGGYNLRESFRLPLSIEEGWCKSLNTSPVDEARVETAGLGPWSE